MSLHITNLSDRTIVIKSERLGESESSKLKPGATLEIGEGVAGIGIELAEEGAEIAAALDVGTRVRGPLGGIGNVIAIDHELEQSVRVRWDANPTWPLWYFPTELTIVESLPPPDEAA